MKCAYCEWSPPTEGWSPIDHFRPKATYWWLTWEWENLLFSCLWCNTRHKGTQFPLSVPADRLLPEAPPPGQEAPLLIDPADAGDPRDHIQYVRLNRKWRPIARDGSELGDQTIRVLGLDQPPMIDSYQCHVKDVLEDRILNVQDALSHANTTDVQRYWDQLVATVDPTRQFAALSADVIEARFDAAELTAWNLKIPPL